MGWWFGKPVLSLSKGLPSQSRSLDYALATKYEGRKIHHRSLVFRPSSVLPRYLKQNICQLSGPGNHWIMAGVNLE
jgi:hypothetical protein